MREPTLVLWQDLKWVKRQQKAIPESLGLELWLFPVL